MLLLAPLANSHAQRYAAGGSRLGAFSGGGAGRAGVINGAAGSRGYSGAAFRNNRDFGGRRGGYGGYSGRSRYFHRGSYYYYDPFFFGGFGYPSYYYGGYGPGFGVGFAGPVGYGGYDGYGEGPYRDRVYSGRIASEVNGSGRRRGDDEGAGDQNSSGDGRYSPGSMTRAVQSELKERGYYRGTVDGQFGAGTAGALRRFQEEKGLKVTGRLDERTLKALGFDQR